MHPFVASDELVGEGETGHETALLEPEDTGKAAGEEDTLDGGEGDEADAEGRTVVVDPPESPLSLTRDTGDSLDGVEEVLPLGGLADVGVDEKGVGLGVNVLHHDLETVEAARLRDLDLARETLKEVLVDDAVGGGEEGEDVGDEVPLVVVHALFPVVEVLGEVHLFGGPERRFFFLVHGPDL